jgi:biotin operon repressor
VPIPHVQIAYRLTDSPDYGDGAPFPRFPKGRVCARDGCETRLSSYNPGPLCRPCTEAARLQRLEYEEAMRHGGKRQQILAYLEERSGHWVVGREITDLLGMEPNHLSAAISHLREQGHTIESDRRGKYRLVHKDGDESPSLPAPSAPGEQPAEEVAGPAAPLSGPPPFAGLAELRVAPDREVATIETCVAALDGLDTPGCSRVMAYLAARFQGRDLQGGTR